MIEAVSGKRGTTEVGGLLGQLGLSVKGEDGIEVRRFWNEGLGKLESNLLKVDEGGEKKK